jgi:hypothetical protein
MAKDAGAKLTDRVTERIRSVDQSSPVEVIVELHPLRSPTEGSRAERIAAAKADFEHSLRDVAERIEEVGGQVIETAWLNQTVRSRIPAAGLERVAETDAVEAIDLPQQLHTETGGRSKAG